MRKLIFIIVLFFSTSVWAQENYNLSYVCGPETGVDKGFIKHEITYDINQFKPQFDSVTVKTFFNYGDEPLEITAETEIGKWELITESYAKLNRSTWDPRNYYFDLVAEELTQEEEGILKFKYIYYWEITNHKTSYYYKLHELLSFYFALDSEEEWTEFTEYGESGSCTLLEID